MKTYLIYIERGCVETRTLLRKLEHLLIMKHCICKDYTPFKFQTCWYNHYIIKSKDSSFHKEQFAVMKVKLKKKKKIREQICKNYSLAKFVNLGSQNTFFAWNQENTVFYIKFLKSHIWIYFSNFVLFFIRKLWKFQALDFFFLNIS